MLRGLLVCALVFASTPARAHDADVIYVSARSGPTSGLIIEVVTLTGAALGQLAPIDADGDGAVSQADLAARGPAIDAGLWDDMPLTAGGHPCARSDATATLREGFVELTARFVCPPGPLRQDFKVLRVLPPNFRVVLGSQVEGEVGKAFAQGPMTALLVPRPPPPGAFSRAAFDAGLGTGVLAALWALLALALVFSATDTRRSGLVTLGAWLLGAAAGCAVGEPLVGAASTAVAVLLVAWRGRSGPLVGALAGLGVTAWSGGAGWSHALGLGLGGAAVGVPAATLASVVGRRLGPFGASLRVGACVAALGLLAFRLAS